MLTAFPSLFGLIYLDVAAIEYVGVAGIDPIYGDTTTITRFIGLKGGSEARVVEQPDTLKKLGVEEPQCFGSSS